jgi:hypothetical protein
MMPLLLFIFHIFIAYSIYIHSITFIQYIDPSPFAGASLHLLIALLAQWEDPPCGAEPRIEPYLAEANKIGKYNMLPTLAFWPFKLLYDLKCISLHYNQFIKIFSRIHIQTKLHHFVFSNVYLPSNSSVQQLHCTVAHDTEAEFQSLN